jgi:pimeloyl-ACP methyl ester carboxylesterase
MTPIRRELAAIGSILALMVCCGDDESGSPSAQPSASSPSATNDLPRIDLPVERGATVEGLVEVDGHDIYARCAGTREPTVVYFTGWAPDLSKRGVEAIRPIETADEGEHRICSYERRNTGRSEQVAGTQSPEDVLADVDGVLAALGEDGPFVLLAASFGGVVAGLYAVAHPERVVGVLLLDASIPDDYVIDKVHGFPGPCAPENRRLDARDSLEKVDNCRLLKWAYDRRHAEPDVPLTYLAASDPSARGGVADDKYRKAFVERWSPGEWKVVDAPHHMDEADPELVVQHLESVLERAGS